MNQTYSFSKLEMYEKCAWAYKKVYIERIPRAESEALIIGKQCHAIVAEYLEHLIQQNLATDWEWAPLAKNITPDVLQIWERFRESFVLPPMEDPRVEIRLAFTRNWHPTEFFAPDAYFRMVIDWAFRQGDLGIIQDWKTNYVIPQTVEKDLQLLTYGWGLKEALYPEVQEVLLRLHFLRYSKEREILLTSEELSGVPDMLTTRIEVIEADTTFSPTPGSFCGWCGVTAHCPVMAEALVPMEVLAPATREQAEKAASLLLTLQRMEKDLAVRLKEWVRENGPIQVGDLIYGPASITSYNLDAQQIVQTLMEAGLSREEIWPLVAINKTSLERGLKRLNRKNLLEVLLSTGKSSISERVDFRKVRD